ncbi:hypothetical protein D3C79_741790 [compost metagenome]
MVRHLLDRQPLPGLLNEQFIGHFQQMFPAATAHFRRIGELLIILGLNLRLLDEGEHELGKITKEELYLLNDLLTSRQCPHAQIERDNCQPGAWSGPAFAEQP